MYIFDTKGTDFRRSSTSNPPPPFTHPPQAPHRSPPFPSYFSSLPPHRPISLTPISTPRTREGSTPLLTQSSMQQARPPPENQPSLSTPNNSQTPNTFPSPSPPQKSPESSNSSLFESPTFVPSSNAPVSGPSNQEACKV